MPWTDRIREAAYKSPSGVRVVFQYENVRKSFDKKTTAFDSPDSDGTYVQDKGHTSRRYPMRVFFWGDDYDLEAAEFDTALHEVGSGILEHPIYGVINVVPFGTITQRDDLKTAANQAIIELTFWETTGLVYPSSQDDPAGEVLTAIDDYNESMSEEFEAVADLDSAIEQTAFKNSYTVLLNNTKAGLQSVADTQENIQKQFDAIYDSINNGIDILVSEPLTFAFQTAIMIQAPSRALTDVTARLDAYNNLANSIITGDNAVQTPGNDSTNSNKFHTDDLYASTYVSGSVVSVVNNQFTTKTEALEAAEFILEQLDNITNWRDDSFVSLSEIDIGGSYQKLQNAVSIAAGFLVQISFTLKQERNIILDRPRTIIDLVAELYGSVDDQLDFFITSNNLSGSEILELPRGRSIVYYI